MRLEHLGGLEPDSKESSNTSCQKSAGPTEEASVGPKWDKGSMTVDKN